MTLNLGKLHATIEIDDKPAGRGIDRVAVKMAGFQKGTAQTLDQMEAKLAKTGADGGEAMGDGIAEGSKAGIDQAANAVDDGAPKLKQTAAAAGGAAGKALGDQMQLRAAEGIAGIYRDKGGRLHLPTGAFVKEGALITEAMLQGARKSRPKFGKEGEALGVALGKGVGVGFARNAEAVHAHMDKMTKKFGGARGLLSMLGKTTAFAAIATGAAGAVSAVGPLVGLVGTLVVAAGGLAGAVAAVAAGGIVALGTLKIGFTDLGAAIAGDEAALERISPAARKFAGVLKELAPAWDRIVRGVQERLFQDLADDLSKVAAKWLPMLDTGLGKVANGWNTVASATARALLKTRVIEGFNKLTGETEKGLQNFAKGIGPWLEGIGVLIGAWSPLLADAGAWTAQLGERWRDWMIEAEETGRLASTIQTMKDTLSLLGDIVGNVGGILGSVFTSANEQGGGLLGTIERLTGQLDTFLNSAEGESKLGTFFQSLSTVGNAVSPIILALAGAVEALAPKIADIAEGVGPSFADLIDKIGDAVDDIDVKPFADGLADVFDGISPLIDPIGKFLDGIIGIDGIVPVLVVSLGAWTVAQWALNIAMYANPILLLITLVLALIAAIVLAVMNWDKIVIAFKLGWLYIEDAFAKGKSAVDVLLRAIADFFIQRWASIVATTQRAIDGFLAFVGKIAAVPGRIAAWLTDMKDRAVAKFQEFLTAASTKIDAVLGVIQRLGGIPGKIAGFVQSAKDQAVSKFNSLVDWVKGLPDRISNALGDLGSLLSNAGRDIINGLLDGIRDKFGDVQDLLGELTSSLPNWKGPEHVDRDLLKGPATWIIGGFADHLESMFPMVHRVLNGLTSDIGLEVKPFPTASGPAVMELSAADRELLSAQRGGTEQTFVVNQARTDTTTLAREMDWLSRRRP